MVVASPGFAQATQATLIGTVRDTSGIPVALARLSSSGLLAISDTAGRFKLVGLPSGATMVTVRRLGFAPRDTAMQLSGGRTDSLFVVLTVLPVDLPEVMAEADAYAQVRHSKPGEKNQRKPVEIHGITAIRISPTTSALI